MKTLQINPVLSNNNNSLWQQTVCLKFCSKGFGSDYRASLSQTLKESETCAEAQQYVDKQHEEYIVPPMVYCSVVHNLLNVYQIFF